MTDVTLTDLTTEDGLVYRTRVAGPPDGEPVLLLHGFPTTSAIWSDLLAALGGRGYRAVAPDQRGYSPGARPDGPQNYRYADIGGDVVRIADALGFESFHLVGHDFGAIAGWAALELLGDRVRSWTALAVPHVRAFGTAIDSDAEQIAMSGYVHRMREPGAVAELVEEWSADEYKALRDDWSALTPPDMLADFVSVLANKEALEATYNWYAGTNGISAEDDELSFGDVAVPTLFIWGSHDPFVARSSCEAARSMMTGPYRMVEADSGHWLQIEASKVVVDEVLHHLSEWPLANAGRA